VAAEMEMMYFECQEMIFESIPGSVMKSYAIINRFEQRKFVQIISLLASAFAVGAISSKMSYYMDTSLRQKERAGNFYGSLSLSLSLSFSLSFSIYRAIE
jgi:hypothetical protein